MLCFLAFFVCVSGIQPRPRGKPLLQLSPLWPTATPAFSFLTSQSKKWKLAFSLQPCMSAASNTGRLPSERAIPALTTLRGCLLCLSSNRCRLMKTKHFRVKAFAARVGLSDLKRAWPDFILKYHRYSCQFVKDSAREPAQHAFLPPADGVSSRKAAGRKCPNGESIWWENPLLSLNPLLVELPFTVVIAPQAPLWLRLLCSTPPEKAAN